jgi:hypothetical protein
VVRLPAVGKLLGLVEEDGVGVWELLQQADRSRPADDDARLPMPREHDAHAAGLEVEGGRVAPPREGMPDEHDVVLGQLQIVRRYAVGRGGTAAAR